MRLLVGLIFMTALGTAGWMLGSYIGKETFPQLFAFAGAFFGLMILMATRTKPL